MAPNMGQGANTAIEAVAVLTNGLRRLVNSSYPDKPPQASLNNLLENFNKKQYKRLLTVHGDSEYVTRMESLNDIWQWWFARYVMEHCGDLLVGNLARIVAGGSVLDFIPLTTRSGKDWPPCPRHNQYGIAETIDFCKQFSAALIVLVAAVFVVPMLR